MDYDVIPSDAIEIIDIEELKNKRIMSNLITGNQFQVLQMTYPSAVADDNVLRVKFTLDVKNGKGVALSGGGIFKGENYIGSFDGLCDFAHNVSGADKEAVDALLESLSDVLYDEYQVEKPQEIEVERPEPQEEENNG